jgi:hypothetical protein
MGSFKLLELIQVQGQLITNVMDRNQSTLRQYRRVAGWATFYLTLRMADEPDEPSARGDVG